MELILFLKIFGLISIVLGGFICLIEIDFKKIIAFSTLRQLGLIVFFLGCGEIFGCFFHLVSHAIFKSFLFLICGIFMRNRFGDQDWRLMGLKIFNRGVFFIIILYSCLRLIGFPFSIGFLSKDYILEYFFSWEFEIFLIFVFYLSCMITICYRIKLYFLVYSYLGFGNVILKLEKFDGGKSMIIFIFFILRCVGIFIEELVFDRIIIVTSINYRVMDFFLFLGGVLLFMINNSCDLLR